MATSVLPSQSSDSSLSLEALPENVLTEITSNLSSGSVANLRMASRTIKGKTADEWARRYFPRRITIGKHHNAGGEAKANVDWYRGPKYINGLPAYAQRRVKNAAVSLRCKEDGVYFRGEEAKRALGGLVNVEGITVEAGEPVKLGTGEPEGDQGEEQPAAGKQLTAEAANWRVPVDIAMSGVRPTRFRMNHVASSQGDPIAVAVDTKQESAALKEFVGGLEEVMLDSRFVSFGNDNDETAASTDTDASTHTEVSTNTPTRHVLPYAMHPMNLNHATPNLRNITLSFKNNTTRAETETVLRGLTALFRAPTVNNGDDTTYHPLGNLEGLHFVFLITHAEPLKELLRAIRVWSEARAGEDEGVRRARRWKYSVGAKRTAGSARPAPVQAFEGLTLQLDRLTLVGHASVVDPEVSVVPSCDCHNFLETWGGVVDELEKLAPLLLMLRCYRESLGWVCGYTRLQHVFTWSVRGQDLSRKGKMERECEKSLRLYTQVRDVQEGSGQLDHKLNRKVNAAHQMGQYKGLEMMKQWVWFARNQVNGFRDSMAGYEMEGYQSSAVWCRKAWTARAKAWYAGDDEEVVVVAARNGCKQLLNWPPSEEHGVDQSARERAKLLLYGWLFDLRRLRAWCTKVPVPTQ